MVHLRRGLVQLFSQLRLKQVDLTIFEVLLTSDGIGSFLTIGFPVELTFLFPLFHEVLVFTEFATIVSSFLLLKSVD